MEQSAAKRRKLSSTSVTAATENDNEQHTGEDGTHKSGHRASFMSPTKASLARFNPDLLPPAQSVGTRGATSRKSPAARTRAKDVHGQGNASNGMAGAASLTDGEQPRGRRDGEHDDGESASSARNGLSVAPRRRSQTPTAPRFAPRVPQTQPALAPRSLPSRTSKTAPQPGRNVQDNDIRVPEQHGTQSNGVRIDESTMNKLPHTPTRHGVPQNIAQIDHSEPSLPSTPSQLGLEPPYQRPKGPLFGTPGKGAKKKRGGPSPSKSKEAKPPQNDVQRPATLILGSKVYLPDLPKPPPTVQQVNLRKKIESQKKLEKEALSSESAHLQDVLLSSWQNPGAKEAAAHQRQGKKVMDDANKLLRLREDIENLETLIVGNDETAPAPSAHIDGPSSNILSTSAPPNLQQRLSLFFPFSHASNAITSNATPDVPPEDREEKVKIQHSELLNPDPNDPSLVLQKHNVEFTRPNGGPIAALAITINSATLSVHDLNMLEKKGSPPMPELQAWLLFHSHSNADSQSTNIPLTSLGTAISRCSTVTDLRAACWSTCRERYPDLIAAPSNVPGNTTNPNLNQTPPSENQETINFNSNHFALSITWRIALHHSDGEVESQLSLSLSFPPAWIEEGIVSSASTKDGKGGEVEAVRQAFDLLVEERGVTEGVLAVVKLLFPDQSLES